MFHCEIIKIYASYKLQVFKLDFGTNIASKMRKVKHDAMMTSHNTR